MGNPEQSLSAEQVSAFLQQNRDFLLTQPEVLQQLQLDDSPAGTISLAQRQREQLQNKNRQLQDQLHALIDNAHSNNALQSRVNQLVLDLLDCQDGSELLTTLMGKLKQEFAADAVALRLFYQGDKPLALPEIDANIAELHADDPKLKAFDHMIDKQQPVCGRLTKAQKELLFAEDADKVHSIACLPLGHAPCAGLLAIASEDANRFHADMGTEYLHFLGEVFMRLLRRFYHGQHS
ncbi:MAG: DUF484 family protein [Methylophaga sp.]|nr:DUF484 family protein [Methylophaga sp.]